MINRKLFHIGVSHTFEMWRNKTSVLVINNRMHVSLKWIYVATKSVPIKIHKLYDGRRNPFASNNDHTPRHCCFYCTRVVIGALVVGWLTHAQPVNFAPKQQLTLNHLTERQTYQPNDSDVQINWAASPKVFINDKSVIIT